MRRAEGLPWSATSVAASLTGQVRAMLLVLMVTLFGTAALVAAAPSAGAASTPRLSWTMTVNGRDIGAADANKPLRLTPRTSPTIALQVTNLGSAPVRVRAARLEGRVLGLPFYSFTTRVDMQIAPGASDERRFSIDLLDLDGQATGLIPSRASLLDNDGNAIVSRSFAVDVRGSLGSVYGTFGLAVAAITLLLLVNALWRLLTGRLHPNRWRRGMTWAAPGLGVGFTLTFTLSALRLMVPGAGVWAALVILGGAIGFLIGYLTPTPERAHRDMSHDGRPWQPLEPPPGAGPGLPPVVDLREPAAPPRRRGAGQPTRPDRP